MPPEKIQISWSDINGPQVEERVRRQEALRQTQEHYKTAPAPEALLRHSKKYFWNNSLFYMAMFGIIGGLLGWLCGEVLDFRPNQLLAANDLIEARKTVLKEFDASAISRTKMQRELEGIQREAQGNPYYTILTDDTLSAAEKDRQLQVHIQRDQKRDFLANLLFYGLSGMMIAMCLALAEPLIERNFQAAAINGCVGALLGLFGGVIVACFIDRIYNLVATSQFTSQTDMRHLLASMIKWGALGVFIAMAPGVVLMNFRRLLVGVLGGLVGGLVGGLLFEPIAHLTGSTSDARLVGLIPIGLLAGFGTGIFENVAKNGWLRVTAGLLAGKQFVLYRNPTYFGSSPQCQIYLFKDPHVGRRHAAVHIVSGGFELENLPLGGATLVNNRPITKTRLKNGDQVQIGSFTFLFQERQTAATT